MTSFRPLTDAELATIEYPPKTRPPGPWFLRHLDDHGLAPEYDPLGVGTSPCRYRRRESDVKAIRLEDAWVS
jgi:hypothetical protein